MADGIDHGDYTVAAMEEAELVTRLRAENERLREALEHVTKCDPYAARRVAARALEATDDS